MPIQQKGFAQTLILLLLLAGISVGVYLVQQRTNLFPKASQCQPRPACLDATPACLIPEPSGGWCPGSFANATSSASNASKAVNLFPLSTYLSNASGDLSSFLDKYLNKGLDLVSVNGAGNIPLLTGFPTRAKYVMYSTLDSNNATTVMDKTKAADIHDVAANIETYKDGTAITDVNYLASVESAQYNLAKEKNLTFIFAPTGRMLVDSDNYKKLAPNADIIYYQTEYLQDNPTLLGSDANKYAQNFGVLVKEKIASMRPLTVKHKVWVQVSINPPKDRCMSSDQVIKYIDSIEDHGSDSADAIVIFYSPAKYDSQCSVRRIDTLKQVIEHYRSFAVPLTNTSSSTPPSGCYYKSDYSKCPLTPCKAGESCSCPQVLVCPSNVPQPSSSGSAPDTGN